MSLFDSLAICPHPDAAILQTGLSLDECKKHGSFWNPFTVKQYVLVFAGSAISSKILCIFIAIALLNILSKALLGTLFFFFKVMSELAICKSVIQFFFFFWQKCCHPISFGNATIWILSQNFPFVVQEIKRRCKEDEYFLQYFGALLLS